MSRRLVTECLAQSKGLEKPVSVQHPASSYPSALPPHSHPPGNFLLCGAQLEAKVLMVGKGSQRNPFVSFSCLTFLRSEFTSVSLLIANSPWPQDV